MRNKNFSKRSNHGYWIAVCSMTSKIKELWLPMTGFYFFLKSARLAAIEK
jgi:hypothetical protein